MWTVQDELTPGTAGETCYTCKLPLRAESPTGQLGHEKALDTGIMIDFEGGLAICETCIVEAGHLIGLITPTQSDVLRETIAFLQTLLKDAETVRDNALSAVRALMTLPAEEPQPTQPAAEPAKTPAKRQSAAK